MLTVDRNTIAAVATPGGRGGVGIIRISGPELEPFIPELVGAPLSPRDASYRQFFGAAGEVIDEGIAIFFPGPASFTGEDVLELQGHGGVVVLAMLLRRVLELGIRQARPGEFSERAFLNGKMDLAQVEAVADLVSAGSEMAAQSALRSLQGQFSSRIHDLVEDLIRLRMYVESAIDFPEEEVDFLADGKVGEGVSALLARINEILAGAQQGALLSEGTTVAIVGRPNAGKSSLMNALARRDTAIVSDIAGTTRDVLREAILLDDLPLHLVDTAGLRDTENVVEQEGVRRAWREIETADQILYVIDSGLINKVGEEFSEGLAREWLELQGHLSGHEAAVKSVQNRVAVVLNKTDLCEGDPRLAFAKLSSKAGISEDIKIIGVSAATDEGMDSLKQHLQSSVGFRPGSEGVFSARQRHLVALELAREHLVSARALTSTVVVGELVAEELRIAQVELGSITGEFTSDDLLGEIFSSFCIGK